MDAHFLSEFWLTDIVILILFRFRAAPPISRGQRLAGIMTIVKMGKKMGGPRVSEDTD